MKLVRHYTHPYLLNPTHPVSIVLCGVGGTGSQVLTGLARMDYALRKLGHPGFNVTVWDGDQVSFSNIGRQLFSETDIGENKAVLLTGRVNRFFGRNWVARSQYLNKKAFKSNDTANILITCVDSVKARQECIKAFRNNTDGGKTHPYLKQLYWLDFGNTKNTGQLVLSTCGDQPTPQPPGDTYETVENLPDVFELYPDFHDEEGAVLEPSCSVMEALSRQDLMINTILANLGIDMLFRMFREGCLNHQGIFYNAPEVLTAKIPLPIILDKKKKEQLLIVP